MIPLLQLDDSMESAHFQGAVFARLELQKGHDIVFKKP